MSTNKHELLSAMKIFMSFIDSLGVQEYNKLISGKVKLKIEENIVNKKQIKIDEDKINKFIDKLNDFNDREYTVDYLERLKMKKNTLIKLAEKLEVRILKNDTKAKIIEKIVESMVGVKLRYKALREADL